MDALKLPRTHRHTRINLSYPTPYQPPTWGMNNQAPAACPARPDESPGAEFLAYFACRIRCVAGGIAGALLGMRLPDTTIDTHTSTLRPSSVAPWACPPSPISRGGISRAGNGTAPTARRSCCSCIGPVQRRRRGRHAHVKLQIYRYTVAGTAARESRLHEKTRRMRAGTVAARSRGSRQCPAPECTAEGKDQVAHNPCARTGGHDCVRPAPSSRTHLAVSGPRALLRSLKRPTVLGI
jgi:hypothetical protein